MLKRFFGLLICFVLVSASSSLMMGQSLTAGDIAGTITDATGAVLPKVQVSATSNATGQKQTFMSSPTGTYRFPFLSQGTYTVSASLSGFQTTEKTVTVVVGETAKVNIQMAVSSSTTSVQVSETIQTVQSENADISTTVTPQEFAALPNSGGDVTYFAQTAPGAVMNSQAGYGNFSIFGMPANSNLITLNGQNNNDPYYNIGNSGATNLLLGANEIAELSIISNGYSGQNGQLAGSQVNYVTKSGSNQFHGNATYFWNGRAVNANNFFNNANGADRPFSNANQWATGGGGPVVKNKTFFYVNYEGIRVVLPTTPTLVKVPTQQFINATLANLTATGKAASVPYYQKIFSVYTGAPGYSSAKVGSSTGCGSFTSLGANVPCIASFTSNVGNFVHESQSSVRVDQNIGSTDRLWVRGWWDDGTQPTQTDPLNPLFNAFSPQPQYSYQLGETHTFNATAVNELNLSAFHYAAQFLMQNESGARALLAAPVSFSGGFTAAGGGEYNFPQGRRVTQLQVADNFSKEVRNHSLKFGIQYHRDDITELGYNTYIYGRVSSETLSNFYNGIASTYQQRFPSSPEQPLFLYQLGFYGQDVWKVTPRLTMTFSMRFDYLSNPTCKRNCNAVMAAPFDTLLSHSASIPYNQVILANQNQAYNGVDKLTPQPRIGFAYSTKDHKTVFRGGFGIFGDAIPAIVSRSSSRNSPSLNAFTIRGAGLVPGLTGSANSLAVNANSSFLSAFAAGQTLTQIQASNPFFALPNFTTFDNPISTPKYFEWNFEVQRELPAHVTLSVNYVGNHGYDTLFLNGGLNAYCAVSSCGGFAGIPTTVPDARFGTISQYQSIGYSNYNGLAVGLSRRFSGGWSLALNYMWSHALDVSSNGGALQTDLSTNSSILNPLDPAHPYRNYGSADNDVRHNFTARYTWEDAIRHMIPMAPKSIFGGWTVAGTLFYRTGLPLTVIDSNEGGAGILNYGLGETFANITGPTTTTCGHSGVDVPCYGTNFSSIPAFGNQGRNVFRGPSFFDTDLTITKDFAIGEHMKLGIGAQFYNLFNHPNFDKPDGDFQSSTFGSIISTVSVPTSIVGSFVGGDASPRLIQFTARVRF